jgi:DNA-binding NarL/FixJ family response regulator
MSNVLIVEDATQLATAVAYQLENWHGYSVSCVRDPNAMRAQLAAQHYDLALVDLLYEHLNQEFNTRRLAGQVSLTAPVLLVTGLTALRTIQQLSPGTRTVVWTSGEANRRLHILYAYEELSQRVFCSKSSDAEHAGAIADALRAAADGLGYVDPVLNSYLPRPGAATISATLLREEVRRAIWRAVALGAHTRTDVARVTGYKPRYVGNQMPDMYADLQSFDPGLPDSHQPLIEIVRYAATNWQFFLDDAVRQTYP